MTVGRRKKDWLEEAVDIILESEVPVSTSELRDYLDLTKMEAISFRRGLRRAELDGLIKELTWAPDGSTAWIRADIPETRCAALLVNMYLKSIDAIRQISTSDLEGMIKNALVEES